VIATSEIQTKIRPMVSFIRIIPAERGTLAVASE
jgi:hypothetical protein